MLMITILNGKWIMIISELRKEKQKLNEMRWLLIVIHRKEQSCHGLLFFIIVVVHNLEFLVQYFIIVVAKHEVLFFCNMKWVLGFLIGNQLLAASI